MVFILCFIYINHIWRENYVEGFGRLNYTVLHTYSTMIDPSFPHEIGFWGLKWSLIRHGIIFLIFAALIYFINNQVLSYILIGLYAVYTWMKIDVQKRRKKLFDFEAEEGNKRVLLPTLKASNIVMIYSIIMWIFLVITKVIAQ